MITGWGSLLAAGVLFLLAIVVGDRDSRGIYIPHGGYTWAAGVCLAVAVFFTLNGPSP